MGMVPVGGWETQKGSEHSAHGARQLFAREAYQLRGAGNSYALATIIRRNREAANPALFCAAHSATQTSTTQTAIAMPPATTALPVDGASVTTFDRRARPGEFRRP